MPYQQSSKAPTQKVLAQAIVTIIAFLLLRLLGWEIDVATQSALAIVLQVLLEGGVGAVILGFAAAYIWPPAKRDEIIPKRP